MVRTEELPTVPPVDHPQRSVDPSEIDFSPHRMERGIQRLLASQPGISVSNLVVRRVGNGVCLTGIVETSGEEADVCGLVKKFGGVEAVMNRLLVRAASGD